MSQSDSNAGDRKPSPKSGAGLDRRAFLRGGAVLAGGATAVAGKALAATPENQPPNVPDWSKYLGPGVDYAPYGAPSEHESHVVRRRVEWLTATPESSVSFTPLHELHGIVTPNGLCFERHHGGVAEVDPADHRLIIHGLVDKPLIFTMTELKRFPPVSRFQFLECAANGGMEWRGAQLNSVQYAHGMVHCVQWTGVPLKTLLQEAGLKPKAKWLLAEGADAAGMTRSIPLDKALDDCLVAYSQNGERLRPEQGYPLRLVVPGWEGNMWIKWLRRIEVGDMPWHTREETSKYTDLMADGTARRFTWVMDAKSVITNPSPEMPVQAKGFNVITGLAWSGRGRITQVHVTLDGGRNWHQARLEEPILPKCLTRFYFDWHWNGEATLLESRAVDETGYVQPSIEDLRAARGR
ncbi:MAG: sulfite dehydrogenase, partial [Rhodospirillales bacterium]|nr:sulfite dehydrogenase [Rhodospirillales bacterium]